MPDWTVKQDIQLSSLAKLAVDANKIEVSDMLWAGTFHGYDKVAEKKVTTKNPVPLKRFETLNFYNVTSSDDPILQGVLEHDACDVIVTDHILAALMSAGRSQYSWDIIVSKVGGKIIFDKRDGSPIDFLTVDETAAETPANDDKDHINAPMRLGQEASCLNQNMTQQFLDLNCEEEHEHPNPFEDSDDEEEEEEDPESFAASGAYRYRKFVLPGDPKQTGPGKEDIRMVVRTEVNAFMKPEALPSGKVKDEPKKYVAIHALNEYNPQPTTSWRQHLDSQRGATLATQLKNNAFKLARWTAEAILSGSDYFKLAFVTRTQSKDSWNHQVLGVQTYSTDAFAAQIGMTKNNMWGIIRSICDIVQSFDDGKYLVLKDPTKTVMRLYSVPWEFGDDDDDYDDDDFDDDE